MTFLDKLFRFKRKPFGEGKKKAEDIKLAGQEAKGEPEAQGTGAYAHVLIRPHISEKSSNLGALNQYVFEIDPRVSKSHVACAVYDLYGVHPSAVRTIRLSGKQLRFGKTAGTTKAWKKAIITLPKGKSIDVYKK